MTDSADDILKAEPVVFETLIGWRRVLHFFTLSAFGVAQPVLSLIPDRTLFLHDLQPRWGETVLFVITAIGLVPLLFVAVDQLWRALVSHRWPKLTNGILFLLMLHVWCSLLRPLIDVRALQKQGASWIVLLSLSGGISALWLTWLKRSRTAERWLLVCSIGIVLFPTHFLWRMAPAIAPYEEAATREAKPISKPIPIVMIVFDEFCGLSLQNEKREVDAGRFPQFARLAKTSTWYRHATTNCGETIDALPALLSGLLPNPARKPIARDYPQNLFQIIQDSQQYEMVVFEPVSRLCDEQINDYRRNPGSIFEQFGTLSLTSLCVYPHLISAKDSPIPMPTIPKPWFGLSHPMTSDRTRRQGLIQYYWDSDRDVQLNHFLDCVSDRESSEFYFMHVVLPHYPWQYLPSGNYYTSRPLAAPLGTTEELWAENDLLCAHAWQKYLLQVGYMDRWLGELQDRLETEGIYDECLLIVTADHGVSFMPGHSRRQPDGENLAEIMSIPLFIKLPGQTVGTVNDRNVESIDVFPTIAAVLQQSLTTPTDGNSLLDETASQRPRKTISFDNKETIAEAAFPQAAKALKRQHRIVGTSTAKDRLFKFGPRADWLGKSLDQFTVVDGHRVVDVVDSKPSKLIERGELVRSLIDCQITDFDEQAKPVTVVCVIDGAIQATTLTYAGINMPGRFQMVLREDIGRLSNGQYELFAVVPGKKQTLERLVLNRMTEGSFEFPTKVAPQKAGTPKTVRKP